MHMIMLVLGNPNLLDDVLKVWHALGISSITMMESSGFHRRLAYVLGTRYVAGESDLVEHLEQSRYTLFAVGPDVQAVQQCLAATEQVVGDLTKPGTGIFVAWEVALAKGNPNHLSRQDRIDDLDSI